MALAAALTYGITRIIPLSAPVADYLVEQTESIASLDFSSALAISSVAAFEAGYSSRESVWYFYKKKYSNSSRNHVY